MQSMVRVSTEVESNMKTFLSYFWQEKWMHNCHPPLTSFVRKERKCFASFFMLQILLCLSSNILSRTYRSIQLKWRHCYNSVIPEWNWIFQLLQRPSGKSLPIWPLRGWKPCASEAQWSWQTKSSVPPTHGLRPTPWTTPTTLAHSWCIFFDFLGTWHFD